MTFIVFEIFHYNMDANKNNKKQENGSTMEENTQCIISGVEGKCRGVNIPMAHRAKFF